MMIPLLDISGIVRTDSSYDTIPADLEHLPGLGDHVAYPDRATLRSTAEESNACSENFHPHS